MWAFCVEQLLLTEIPPVLDESESFAEKSKDKDTTTFVGSRGAPKTGTIEYNVDKQEIDKKVEFDRPRGAPVPKGQPGGQFVTNGITGTVDRGRTSAYAAKTQKSSGGGGGGFIGKMVLAAAAVGGVAFVGPQFGISVPVLSEMLGAKSVAQTVSAPANVVSDPIIKGATPPDRKIAEQPMVPATTGQSDSSLANGKPVITLKINLSPAGSGTVLSINGKTIDPEALAIQVPLDSPLELSVERPNFKKFTREFSLQSAQLGSAKETTTVVTLVAEKSGILAIHGNLSAQAIITSDDGTFTKTMASPFDGEALPIGKYTVKIVNDVLDLENAHAFVIEENKINVIEAGLKPRSKH